MWENLVNHGKCMETLEKMEGVPPPINLDNVGRYHSLSETPLYLGQALLWKITRLYISGWSESFPMDSKLHWRESQPLTKWDDSPSNLVIWITCSRIFFLALPQINIDSAMSWGKIRFQQKMTWSIRIDSLYHWKKLKNQPNSTT